MASAKHRQQPTAVYSVLLLLLSLCAIAVGLILLLGKGPGSSDIEVMEQRLRDMRQLKTVSRTYRSVIWVEERNFWKGRKEVLFSLEYEISAGVDFSKGLEIENIGNSVYQVRMPEAEVFSSDAVESSIRQMIIREKSVINQINMGDYMPHVIDQGHANRQSAIEAGILEQAEANARKAVVRVLRLGDIKDVVFEDLNPGDEDD